MKELFKKYPELIVILVGLFCIYCMPIIIDFIYELKNKKKKWNN